MDKWNRAIKSIMITSVSITFVRFLADYVDLIFLRPDVYAMRSAPWYADGLVYGAVTLVVLFACSVIKTILKYKFNNGT